MTVNIKCFDLDSNGDLSIVGGSFVMAEDTDAIQVMLECKLNQFEGDWYLDRNEGLDYYGEILGKKQVDEAMKSEFIIGASEVIGVTEISSFTAAIIDRELQVEMKASTVFSENVEFNSVVGI